MTCHFYITPFLQQNRHLDKMLAQLDLMKTLFERAGGANRIISTRHKKSSYNVSLFLLQFCKNVISLPVSLLFSVFLLLSAITLLLPTINPSATTQLLYHFLSCSLSFHFLFHFLFTSFCHEGCQLWCSPLQTQGNSRYHFWPWNNSEMMCPQYITSPVQHPILAFKTQLHCNYICNNKCTHW